jgi:hypothetical protein
VLQLGNLAFEIGDILAQLACDSKVCCARDARSSPLVLQALLHAPTHQPTFGNKLVPFLCGDASVARSGQCIQLDG